MKAVLEFNYPEDERRLLYAVKGKEMYVALVNLRVLAAKQVNHKADMADTLDGVRNIIDDIFYELGE
jgi:hypothetical protein